jgi:hypothetical protein
MERDHGKDVSEMTLEELADYLYRMEQEEKRPSVDGPKEDGDDGEE